MAFNVVDKQNYEFKEGMTKQQIQSEASGYVFGTIGASYTAPDMNTLTTGGLYAFPVSSDSNLHQPTYSSGESFWMVTVYSFTAPYEYSFVQVAVSVPQSASYSSRVFIRFKATSTAQWSNWQQINGT